MMTLNRHFTALFAERASMKCICRTNCFICDECVELCMDIIRERHKSLCRAIMKVCLHPQILMPCLMIMSSVKPRRNCSSVAVHNRKRLANAGKTGDLEIAKSNILLVGPTGCGKTLLCNHWHACLMCLSAWQMRQH